MLSRRALLKASVAGLWLPAGRVIGAAERNPDLIVHSRVPLNAETPLARLVESWITPNDLFYVRSHAPVPNVDVDAFRL